MELNAQVLGTLEHGDPTRLGSVTATSPLARAEGTPRGSRTKLTESGDAAIVHLSGQETTEPRFEVYTPQGRIAAPAPLSSPPPSQPGMRPAYAPYEPHDNTVRRELEQSIKELRVIDADVRRHEQTHLSALGPHALSGIQYQLSYGPDALPYATGGRIAVDLSPAESPEETVEKARTIRDAALAVDYPSKADLEVAEKASRLEQEALQQCEKG